MAAFETITVHALDPANGKAGSPVAGNSLTLRNGKGLQMAGMWQTRAETGKTSIHSPLMHDAVTGVQMSGPAGSQKTLIQTRQDLESQDRLSVTMTGHVANGGNQEEHSSFNVYYKDLPGVDAHLIDHGEYLKRVTEVIGVSVSITAGITDYGAQVPINAIDNQFKAGEDYAIVGMFADSGSGVPGSHAIRVTGPDWGNLGLAVPGSKLGNQDIISQDWFSRLSFVHDLPLIPVFNADNRDQTVVDAIAYNAAAIKATIIIGKMGPKKRGR